ncbi:histidine kinase [Streptomyces sp. NPDC047072]|uniref:sensor histidine kinase n=1 Tax=Streptomyces sp. NPDC047072 TaxID=3154809 RepID=UPI0033FE16B5
MSNSSAIPAGERLRAGWAALTRPSGALPRLSGRDLVLDALLAAVAVVVGVDDALSVGTGTTYVLVDGVRQARPEGAATWVGAVGPMLMATVPLALRRRFPLTVLWIVAAASLLAPDSLARTMFYVCVIATYGAVVHSPYPVPALASVPAVLLVISLPARNPELPDIPAEYVPYLILVPLAVVAYGMRTWRLRAGERQARMAELERRRDEELRRAAEQERARIARELHDVVTHNVSMMVIQAGAARRVLDAAPAQAREAMLAVEAGGRAAMTELRHAMGLLTMNAEDADGDAVGRLVPQPGLAQVEALVRGVRDSGAAVDLTVKGTPRDVPPGTGLAVYRVVQEALTNTVKHAAGAAVSVTIAHGPTDLHVEITDTGGAPTASAAGDGHGLLGLRERLAVYGGTLRTGPTPDGGYRVLARIPLPAPETETT